MAIDLCITLVMGTPNVQTTMIGRQPLIHTLRSYAVSRPINCKPARPLNTRPSRSLTFCLLLGLGGVCYSEGSACKKFVVIPKKHVPYYRGYPLRELSLYYYLCRNIHGDKYYKLHNTMTQIRNVLHRRTVVTILQ